MSKADVFNDYWHCFHIGLHCFFNSVVPWLAFFCFSVGTVLKYMIL